MTRKAAKPPQPKCSVCGRSHSGCRCFGGVPRGPRTCQACHRSIQRCQCPARLWTPPTALAPTVTPAVPESIASPQAVASPGSAGAFAAVPVSVAELAPAAAPAAPVVYAAPSSPPTGAGTAPPLAAVSAEGIAAAVREAAAPAPGTALEVRAQRAEKVALSVEEVAQLRGITIAVTQGIFFLNNWAMGKYYYKVEVLDLPPPLPAHVAAGADLLQPVVAQIIGTHTTLGAIAAFGAVLAQHNIALSRAVAKTRATAIKQAATDDTAAAKATLNGATPAAPRTATPPPSPATPGNLADGMTFTATPALPRADAKGNA